MVLKCSIDGSAVVVVTPFWKTLLIESGQRSSEAFSESPGQIKRNLLIALYIHL